MSIQNKVLTIGIWGNYNYGNWGDDLMAIIIAEYIKKNGHRTIVYRLDEDLSKEHNIPSERSVDKLVRDSDFLLIGGGGMLVGNSLVKSSTRRYVRYERGLLSITLSYDPYRQSLEEEELNAT